MRMPRDVSGAELVRRLERLGYVATRQSGSHIRLTTMQKSAHHITVPAHSPLRLGTLAAILASVAEHHGLSKEDLFALLFD